MESEWMSTADVIHERRDEVLRVAARHGASNVRLFGSVARGEDAPDSNVDLLVDVTGATTPWFPGSLTAELVIRQKATPPSGKTLRELISQKVV